MITATADKEGRVVRIGTADETLPAGAVELPFLPEEPAAEPGTVMAPWLEDGALVWKAEPMELENPANVSISPNSWTR